MIVGEMTGNYNLLLPTLAVCAVAFLLSDEQSIYSAQFFSRSRSPAHKEEYVREVLAGRSVERHRQALEESGLIRLSDSVVEIVRRFQLERFSVLPVVDDARHLLGVVTIEEVHLAAQSQNVRAFLVAANLMHDDLEPLRLHDSIDRALEIFVEYDVLALPVVPSATDTTVVGMVQLTDVAGEYLANVQGASKNYASC